MKPLKFCRKLNEYKKLYFMHTRTYTFGFDTKNRSTKHLATTFGKMVQINYLKINIAECTQQAPSVILSERFAIVSCGLLISVFAFPILIVIQTLAAIFQGIIIPIQLLNSEGLFNEENQLYAENEL
ncbi:MAG TPA: hypothetical protein V6C90_28555 [Coleofasciculaceae cyanobacterium]